MDQALNQMIVGLVLGTLVSCVLLYFVIRLAVKHAILAAREVARGEDRAQVESA